MYLVKRYPNRKLYDTVQKKYVTLNEVGELVAQGHDIKVVDHETEEDLTTIILSQVIYDQEKKRNGFISKKLLSGLIQKGGDFLGRLPHSIHNFLNLEERDLEDIISGWQKEGILAKEHKERVKEDLLFLYGDNKLHQLLEESLREYDFPTRKELEKLKILLIALENLWKEKESPPESKEP